MKSNTNLILNHILWRGLYYLSILIINIIIARLFAVEKSGAIFYIVNNLSFILLLVSFSLESGTTYYISIERLDVVQMARFCIFWCVLVSLLAFLIWRLFAGSVYASGFYTHIQISVLLFIPGVLFTTFFNALFYSKKEFNLPNKLMLIVNSVLILLMIIFGRTTWLKQYFIQIYFSSFLLQGLILCFIFVVKNKQQVNPVFPPLFQLKKVFSYSAAALFANIIYFLVNRVDYWFIERYCSSADLGNYIQASKLVQMMLVLPSIISTTLFPLIASEKNKFDLTPVIRLVFWINLILCIFLSITGFWLFPFIFGESFRGLYTIFLLLVPGLLCLTSNYPMTASNSGNNLIRRNIMGSFIALVIIVTGDFIILPMLGVLSAAVICSLGYCAYYIYILYHYRKENYSELKNFFLIRKTDFRQIGEHSAWLNRNKAAQDFINSLTRP